MQKTSFSFTVLVLTISILSLLNNTNTLTAFAVVQAPAPRFTLQIDNELVTNPDKISLCENGVFRKGWDGTVKGGITEPDISTNSVITILYGSVTGSDCTTSENSWKKIKELSPARDKYLLNGDTLNITLSGSATLMTPADYLAPELATPANSSSNNRTQVKIIANPDLQTQPLSQYLCVDGSLLTETSASSSTFITTSGIHKIKFVPTASTSGALPVCDQVSNDYARDITVADGEQTNITAKNKLDYKSASVSGLSTPIVISRPISKSSATISNLDPDQTGIIVLAVDDNNFVLYNPLSCDMSLSAKTACARGKHFASATLSSKKLISIEYDPATSQPDDELSISEISVSKLFGGVFQSSNGVISPRDSASGLPTGKLLQNPISLSLKNRIGHITIIKLSEISSVVSKSSVNGEHVKEAKILGLVSNSPFVSVPTTYTANAQGDYVFSSSINSAVGQYVLLDTAETSNDSVITSTANNGLIRTGGESNQNKFIISLFGVGFLGLCATMIIGFQKFKKK